MASRNDLLFLQKMPPPRSLVDALRRRNRTVILDLDDAIYFGYPGGSARQARVLKGRVLQTVEVVDLVTVSSPIIAADLEAMGARNVLVYPGPYTRPKEVRAPTGPFSRLLWLGSPSTFPSLRNTLLNGWEELRHDCEIELLAVGAPLDATLRAGVRLEKWSQTREISALRWADVGLMPLERSGWNDRKAAYKVLEYIANGLLPLASAGPALTSALGNRVSELCIEVASPSVRDWQAALSALSLWKPKRWETARRELFDAIDPHAIAKRILVAAGVESEP